LKHRNTIILTIGLLIGALVVWIFNSKLIIPYIDFSILLLLSVYVWIAIKKKIKEQNSFVKVLLSMLFWLPLTIVFIGSVTLFFFKKLDDWPSFLRIYFIGGLFTYIFSLIFPVLFLFLSDIVRWFQTLFKTKKNNSERIDPLVGHPITRKKFIVNTGLSLGGIALSTMGFGMLHGNYNFKIWKHRLKINRASVALRGLRIVQISDMHLGTWASKEPLEEAIEYINSLKADLIFFTGDLVNARTAEVAPFVSTLKKMTSKYGIYASLGNHDYGHYYKWKSEIEEQKNAEDILDFYKEVGWRLLRNENDKIMFNEEKIQIIGVENWSQNPRFPQKGDLEIASDLDYNASLNLLLSHDPTHWEQKVKQFEMPIDITFSGHTHGFQFGIESELFRWSPAQYIYKHWAGMYFNDSKDKYLYVNRGIGAIGFPGRVGIKPEITLVELV